MFLPINLWKQLLPTYCNSMKNMKKLVLQIRDVHLELSNPNIYQKNAISVFSGVYSTLQIVSGTFQDTKKWALKKSQKYLGLATMNIKSQHLKASRTILSFFFLPCVPSQSW